MSGAGNIRRRLGRAAWLASLVSLTALFGVWLGSARADFDDALKAYERGEDAVVARELRPLLSTDSPPAFWLMGRMRESGRGGGPPDAADAARWYRKAAAGGNVPAMLSLGELCLRGQGVPQSDGQAGDWFKKAAAKGSAQGFYLLGRMRLDGRLGPATDAPGYLRRAIAAGSPEAALTLGELALAGRVVPRDPGEAYRLALAGAAMPRADGAVKVRLAALALAAEKELPAATALALRSKKQPDNAPKAVPLPDGQMRTGTGFVVSRLGHVLTNAHVAQECGRIDAVIDGRLVAATPVRFDPANDLALLRLAVAPPRAMTFREANVMAPGTTVYAAGYPGERARTVQLRITSGRTRELASGVGGDKGVAVSAEVLPGNSGGPLLDGSGRVAGVVRAKRNSDAVRERVGGGMADVGFAVPLAEVKAFLARGQTPIVTAPSGRSLDTAALARELSGVVVPLYCRPGR